MAAPNEQQQQPIIVVKKKGGHGGHHGGAWKVAYADFVTAMMAFFLVMWLVTQDQIIKENVAGYFNDPGGWGKGIIGQGTQSILKGGESLLKNMKGPRIDNRAMTEARAREVLKQTGERIHDALTGLPDFESINEHIEIEMTEEGLRIELIEASSADEDSAFFYSLGSADLSETGKNIITTITKEIGLLNNLVVIEGHTDSRQFTYKAKYSNWELSADRANSARKLMQTVGLKPGQIDEIRGYADNRLKYSDNPKDPRNRRITILVLSSVLGIGVKKVALHDITDEYEVKDLSQ